MSSSRSSRSSHSGSTRSSGSRSSTSSRPSQQTLTLLTHLQTNPPTTLSSVLHLEQTITSSITSPSPSSSSSIQIPPSDLPLFQAPMTAAFHNYVITTSSLLVELRGLTPQYPFSAQIVSLAVNLVRADPESDRSWNLAWLVLNKILNEGLIERVAWEEAGWEGYWGGRKPSEGTEGHEGGGEREMLAGEMEREWRGAVEALVGCWGGRRPVWC